MIYKLVNKNWGRKIEWIKHVTRMNEIRIVKISRYFSTAAYRRKLPKKEMKRKPHCKLPK